MTVSPQSFLLQGRRIAYRVVGFFYRFASQTLNLDAFNRAVKEWIEKTASKTSNGRVDGIDNYSKAAEADRGRFRRRSAARKKKRQNEWGEARSQGGKKN